MGETFYLLESTSLHDDWNPENILARGLVMLDFMEKRWNLKFEDVYAKTELLFLEFMLPEEEIEENETSTNS